MQERVTETASEAPAIRYAYKASLIGAAHQFELTEEGFSFRFSGRSGVWRYAEIAAIRLSYRPVSMQSRRFRADIHHSSGARIAILSTTWQTAALMAPQDRPDLARNILRQRLMFSWALCGVEARLALQTLGLGTVDVRGLVGVMETMREQLRTLSQNVQTEGASI